MKKIEERLNKLRPLWPVEKAVIPPKVEPTPKPKDDKKPKK